MIEGYLIKYRYIAGGDFDYQAPIAQNALVYQTRDAAQKVLTRFRGWEATVVKVKIVEVEETT